ncbi:hypothetical protein EG68_04398 [Paragonimus skrjabini miyazakii]|uniref:Iron-sulfur cluster assembly 2 homolog, mitochondrial n=1 Tax=Paragonimus skrjabini miyazakii TaxID=59628 RepID=A0A8S9YE16_9TREM|nr:hypothetical protein EG68_04398 [Paragonimus skrjabini miyazakii]
MFHWLLYTQLRSISTCLLVTRSCQFSSQSSAKAALILSDKCVQRLRLIQTSTGRTLRVLVDSGGCSGFQYKFEMAHSPTSDDHIISQDDVRVIVDDVSLKLLEGATIDYEDELIRSGFRVTKNPQAEKGCSCGVSFALKMD